jgi:hypothetical protein
MYCGFRSRGRLRGKRGLWLLGNNIRFAALAVAIVVLALIGSLQRMADRWPPGSESWSPSMRLRHQMAARNCDAARAVGLAPARRGEPGYYPRHDEDNDGIACEPWSGLPRRRNLPVQGGGDPYWIRIPQRIER